MRFSFKGGCAMNIENLFAVASMACCAVLTVSAYDSSSYVQSGLIAQWDGIDNVGTGMHNPNATTWKDLKGNLDMTLTAKGSWTFNGNALHVAGGGAGAQGASATPAYKTIEVVYKMTSSSGRILFTSGINTRFVIFDGDSSKKLYFDGSTTTKYIAWPYGADEVCFAAATYDGSTVSNVYFNGNVRADGTLSNGWGTGDGKVAVGDRTLSKSYPWTGDIYAIRLYDRALTAEEIARNAAIDKARFLPPKDEEIALTSSSYVQEGLVGQYDGIDNVGTGTHDPAATTWKDLAGDNDLTLTNSAAWCRGIGLGMDQIASSKAAAFGRTVAPMYKTIEVLFKATSRPGRILLWSGDRSRYVVFDNGNVADPFVWAYFDGRDEVIRTGNRPTPYIKMQSYVPASLVATYGANDDVANVYCDGVERFCGRSNNYWGNGDGVLSLGGRVVTSTMSANYGWAGEIYAIRFYNRVLTDEEIARNHAIDVKRFYTSAIYAKDGMTSFWDAKDNAGENQHSDTATTWKNLVAGGQDLTLNNSSWAADSLRCANVTKSGAYGTAPETFTSMEVAFRHEDNVHNGWLFSGGVVNYYCVLATYRSQWCNNEGLYKTFDFSYAGFHSLATTRATTTTNAYVDGVSQAYENRKDPPRAGELDGWGAGDNYVQVGGRSNGSANFDGRIYSVRLYDNVPSKTRIWGNSEIDRKRYENPLTWHGPSSDVGDGYFETYGNWVDIDQTVRVPDASYTVNLPCGTYKITLTADRTVAAIRARNGNVETWGRYIDATLDMGGKTFTLLGDYQADAARGVEGNRYASLTLTNGTFKAEGVQIGALAERVPDTVMFKDFATAFGRGSGSFNVEGADTTVSINRHFRLEGPFTQLRVAGGAKFSCAGIRVCATQSGDERAKIEFTGAGTTASIGADGLYVHRDVDVTVSDGASFTMTGGYEYFAPLGGTVNSFGRNYGTAPGNSSHFVVDNATVTLTNYPFVVGAALDTVATGDGASFALQNNAKLVMKGSGMSRFVIGAGANNATAHARGNVLNVLDGSVFGYGTGGASARLEIGICGNTSFSGVNVSNATVNCVRLMAGSRSAPAASSNNFVNVMGETAKINVSGTGADSIYLRMGARLKFTIPENGFAEPPIITAGGVKVENDEALFAVDPVKLVIDASAFKGDRVTLISCVSNSTYYLQRLVSNTEYVGRHCGRPAIEDGGTKLVYKVYGTRVIIR